MRLLQIFKDSIFHSWLIASRKHVIKMESAKFQYLTIILVVIESIQELFSYESLKRASIEYGG